MYILFPGGILDLTVLVPDHCLSYLLIINHRKHEFALSAMKFELSISQFSFAECLVSCINCNKHIKIDI